jgi:hypothetical protein
MAELVFEPLDRDRHERAAFSCGEETLDRWLKTQAAKEAEAGSCVVMVALNPTAPTIILGFYSLSAQSLPLTGLSPEQVKALKRPRYAEAGTTLLGRLGRSMDAPKGFGQDLVSDALLSAFLSAQRVGSIGVTVDPKNERLVQWYCEEFDFVRLPHSTRLLLPMAHIERQLRAAGLIEALSVRTSRKAASKSG